MNAVDGVLVLVAALALLVGWRLGLVCGLLSILAIGAGGTGGFLLGRALGETLEAGAPLQTLVVMGCTVLGIGIAQLVTSRPAQRLHDAVARTRLRYLNSAGGAVLTLGFMVMVVWMLATALALAPSTMLASAMRGSTVLVGMDRTVPGDAGPLLQRLEISSGLPTSHRVFSGLGLVPTPDLPVPAAADLPAAALGTAEASVLRILGHAVCGTTLAGSGIVVDDDLVLTNAHVIAGVPTPVVFTDDRRIGIPSVPVYFDPATDLALLHVPDLDAPAARISPDAAAGDVVAIAGYPGGGTLQVTPAAVRGAVTATGTDLYGVSEARRDILVISGNVSPGDSGGALIGKSGDVVGVIFAASMRTTGETAYALTGGEAAAAMAGVGSGGRVDTGGCVGEDAPEQ